MTNAQPDTLVTLSLKLESFDTDKSLAAVQQSYGIRDSEIDSDFGVILIDPQQSLYCIKVTKDVADRLNDGSFPEVKGSFPDSPIEPFHAQSRQRPPRPGAGPGRPF